MTEQNRIYTHQEYERKYFPSEIFFRLKKELCEYLGLDKSCQYRSSPSKQNPGCGFMEVAQPGWVNIGQIREWLKSFYKGEGYTVVGSKSHENSLIVKNDKNESFLVIVAATDSSFIISIFHSL